MTLWCGATQRLAGLVLVWIVSSPAPPLGAQTASPESCAESDAFSALDFWVGEWTVHVGEQRVGTNRIEKILDGCAVAEHWVDAGGGRGQSLFYYIPAEDSWKQVWVTEQATTTGGVKEKGLVARLPDGGVRFQGEIALPQGGSYLDRTTLSLLPDGRVRQHIEISTDGGTTWRTTFDAEYRPTGS